MVERNLTTLQQPTNVVPDQVASQYEEALGNAGQTIIKAQQEALMTKNFSQAYMDLNDQKFKIQQQYADDPMKGVEAYQQYRAETLSSYGDQISPLFRGQWDHQTRTMAIRDDMQMNAWAYGQARQNTQDSINTAIGNHMTQANTDGANYGSGKVSDLDALLNYAPAKQDLLSFGTSNLGTKRTNAMMDNYDHDYMKSFLSGVAQTNPQKAAQLMDDPRVGGMLTTEDRNEFAGLIEKTQKSNELIDSLKVTQNTQAATDLINDQSKTFFDKRNQLDRWELNGAISSKTAANARRVLTSQEAVDAVTDAPVMADLTTKIYDLNSQQGMNNKDYLMGVQNLHNEILQAQANGKLNASDVQKMNNEMKTLTSARVASATKEVGMEMYDATQQFTSLPPEYRGEATRQLFYMTNGQQGKLSDDAYSQLVRTSTQKVIDNINQERRAQALKAVTQPASAAQPLSDEQFMQKMGFTRDELEYSAKQHNMTPDEAMKWLRKQNGQ